ncbi:ImmA/IrrE family metallo-endopeptidase [Lentzea sp. NPDC058436]|uniref:ImmA/IrrE family metallo-endopeptidase n=1 Tax=Lentzea sp. NPDC058436 TaxID=3346499 RepID=UPI00364D5C30
MPKSKHSSAHVQQLAVELLQCRENLEPGLTDALRSDLYGTIVVRSDVRLQHDNVQAGASSCSIAAAYLRDTKPPRIMLNETASPGRELFSLGHEFAHFLIDHDEVLADALWADDEREDLEEDICNAFAALLLLGEDAVERALDGGGVTASAVRRLFITSEASREAVAVAMAQRLRTPGYVMIASVEPDEDMNNRAVARFTARANGALPIRRDTPQDGTLIAASFVRGRARGEEQLLFPSGARTEALHCDILVSNGYAFGVFVTDHPPWGGLSVLAPSPAGHQTSWCEHCGADFRPSGAACRGCGEHECPTCRRCSCVAAAAPQARLCPGCFTEKPGHSFVGDKCRECVE